MIELAGGHYVFSDLGDPDVKTSTVNLEMETFFATAQDADYIIYKMDRGVTVLKAVGWYTKQEKDVLLLLMRRNEVPEVSKKIKELDSSAFMTVNPVGGVYGEGFEEIKAGISSRKNKKDGNA